MPADFTAEWQGALQKQEAGFILLAMTVRPVIDYTPYLKYAREVAARRRADKRLAARREIAGFLRQEYHPRRIVAFGSLVHPDLFHHHSDVDIAVEGIPWPEYLRAWNAVQEKWPEFKVDLIDVAIISERMRQRIAEQGQQL